MFWEELYLRRRVPDSTLTTVVARLFGVPPTAVLVTDSVQAASAAPSAGTLLLLERQPTGGDFELRVRIYIRDAKLELLTTDPALVRRFATFVGTDCLTSDDSPSSTSWLLIRPEAAPIPVRLNADRLDDNEYVLTSGQAARAS